MISKVIKKKKVHQSLNFDANSYLESLKKNSIIEIMFMNNSMQMFNLDKSLKFDEPILSKFEDKTYFDVK